MSSPLPPDEMSAQALRDFCDDNQEFIEALAAMRVAFQRFTSIVERYSRDFGLTLLQYTTLVALAAHRHDNPYTVGELAIVLSLTHVATVQLLNRMEAKRLIERVEDQRVVRVHLTEAGMRVMYALWTAPPVESDEAIRVRETLIETMQRVIELEAEFIKRFPPAASE